LSPRKGEGLAGKEGAGKKKRTCFGNCSLQGTQGSKRLKNTRRSGASPLCGRRARVAPQQEGRRLVQKGWGGLHAGKKNERIKRPCWGLGVKKKKEKEKRGPLNSGGKGKKEGNGPSLSLGRGRGGRKRETVIGKVVLFRKKKIRGMFLKSAAGAPVPKASGKRKGR